jgi:hypothetical protein
MTGRADRPTFPARRIARRRLRPLGAGRCKSEVAFAPSDLCNNHLRLAACGAKRPFVHKQDPPTEKELLVKLGEGALGRVTVRSRDVNAGLACANKATSFGRTIASKAKMLPRIEGSPCFQFGRPF